MVLFWSCFGIGLWLSLLLKSAFSLVGLSAYLYVLVELDSLYTTVVAIVPTSCVDIKHIWCEKVGNANWLLLV
ncbi:MAG: hypothetical protein CM15mP83_1840 [Flavobacteriaceae bacterium]|nr:MAG: hypothetical protein CM15mP83_1840 [Flavobacteriaceae bacterium]